MDTDIVNLIVSARDVFDNFRSGIFVGLSCLFYLFIQILRGKAGFTVPFVTEKFNSIKSTAIKTWVVVGLFAVIGSLTSISKCGFSFNVLFDGLLAGLSVGFATLGFRSVSKTTLASEEFTKVTDSIKQALKKKDK